MLRLRPGRITSCYPASVGARLIANEFSEEVPPEQVRLLMERRLTNEEVVDKRAALLGELEALCGHFPMDRAVCIMASMFPAYCALLRQSSGNDTNVNDPERLREFAIGVLDDDFWAEIEKAIEDALAKPH